jgi:hypothetical protein
MRAVYILFSEVFSFPRKNRAPFLFSVISLLLSQLIAMANRSQVVSIKYLVQPILLLGNVVIDLFVILYVYKLSGITLNTNSVFENAYLYLRRILGVSFLGGILTLLVSFLLIIPFEIFVSFKFSELPNFVVWFFIIVFGVLYLAFVRLGYQILILKNTTIWNSIKLGYRELNRNLHFYLQVLIATIVLFFLFDLFVFLLMNFGSSNSYASLFPVARRVSIALSSPITTVIYTFAFLSKNPVTTQIADKLS